MVQCATYVKRNDCLPKKHFFMRSNNIKNFLIVCLFNGNLHSVIPPSQTLEVSPWKVPMKINLLLYSDAIR